MLLIITAAKYLMSLLLMFAISAVGIAAESLCRPILSVFIRDSVSPRAQSLMKRLAASYRRKIILPESAKMPLSLYGPALSFAALMPVCAAIPFCTLIPIMENGADVLQILQFYMLSEVIAISTVYSLGTKEAGLAANKCIKESFLVLVPLVSFIISTAAFFEAGGGSGDAFSLNAFSLSQKFADLGAGGLTGVIIFIFLIFTQIPHRDVIDGTLPFDEGEMPAYQGCPRTMLQLRGIFRSFIVIVLVVNMFFPLGDFALLSGGSYLSWNAQIINFLVFWLVVIFARVVLVNLSWLLFDAIERRLPSSVSAFFVPAASLAAAALILHEVYIISSEIAAF